MERVLLVDDEPQVLVALEDLLDDEFIVLKTESPQDAVRMAESDHDIAVVISDERMPKMPGGELFARIRESSNARRILVTGFADLSAVIRAVNDGKIFAYVTKPWDSNDLKRKVHQAADQFRLVKEVGSERQLLQDLMDSTPDGIYFKDRELRIRSANRSFAKLLNASDPDELVGKAIEDINADLPHLASSRLEEERLIASGDPALDVVRDYSDRERKRWVSETKAPIRDPRGQVLGMVGIARDVTERVLMEETLRESEGRLVRQTQLLNTILNSMRAAVIASEHGGSFILFNRQAQAMFGTPDAQLSALEWAHSKEVFLPNETTPVEGSGSPLVRAILGESTDETEVSIRGAAPDEATLTITGTPLMDETGGLVGGLALVRDVTRQKLLERQLAQAQKMEAIGRLAGGVAHDFNNLLSVIIAYANFAQKGLPVEHPQRADLAEVLAAAERATGLTRQLLAIGRRRATNRQALQLNDIVSSVEKMMRRVIGEHITLSTLLAPALAPINVDAGQLEQILLNLTVNARDAMLKGGTLTFQTENIKLSTGRATRYSTIAPGRYVLLSVADTGTGMSDETIKRMFEPFYTTKEVGKGTGLGLATVYAIVEQSGGHIDVESEVGKGTTIRIYLPCVDSDSIPARGRPSSRPPLSRRTARILLVEDDDSVRRVSRRILEARGHTVLEAKSPSEALAMRGGNADIDLLLADVVLPEMSGPKLANELLESYPSMRVLFMSGYPDAELANAERFEPQVEWLEKPFTPYSLAEKVREILDGPR